MVKQEPVVFFCQSCDVCYDRSQSMDWPVEFCKDCYDGYLEDME